MKRNAIVRIILNSVGIFVMLSLLITGLGASFLTFEHDREEFDHTVSVNQGESIQFDAHSIRNIEINWTSGQINIAPDERVSEITVCESGPADQPMVCKVSGNTLKIDFSKEKHNLTLFGMNSISDKTLAILIPEGWICDSLEIDTASANVLIQNMTIEEYDFDGASGACSMENCVVGDLNLDTASGNLNFEGSLTTLDCDSASADCKIVVTNVPRSIDMDAASGNLELYLPENCGFTCSLDGLSGSFQSEYPTTMQNGHHKYGDGSCKIEVEAMSGDVKILKAASHHEDHHSE